MEVDNETQSVVDYAIADQEFMTLIPAIYQSALNTKGTGAATSFSNTTCDTLAFMGGDTTSFTPNPVFSLNPDNAKCSGIMPDGKSRSGKITSRFTGKISVAGSQIIVKLNNYVAGGRDYTCDSLVATIKESTSSYITFNIRLINGICKTSTFTIRYKCDRTVTVYPKGDVTGTGSVAYLYGEVSGTNRQGINFSATVAQGAALVKHRNCQFIDKGIMELTPEGFKTRSIDFGDGSCDDGATFTVNENTVAFKLK